MKRRLGVLVISRNWSKNEDKLLTKNLSLLEGSSYTILPCLVTNVYPEYLPTKTKYLVSEGTTAQFNRILGLQYFLSEEDVDYVWCLDSDMEFCDIVGVVESIFHKKHDLYSFNRLDILKDGQKRHVNLKIFNGEPKTLFGSFVVRPGLVKYMIDTDDFEEQWFLLSLKLARISFYHFDRVLIHHHDYNTKMSKIRRYLFSNRGVGYWQGFFVFLNKYKLISFDRFMIKFTLTITAVLLSFASPIFIVLLAFNIKEGFYLLKGLLFYVATNKKSFK